MLLHAAIAQAVAFVLVTIPVVHAGVQSDPLNWRSLKISGGGGFVPGVIFNTGPKGKGVAYIRTDIGGAYRWNSDDSWTQLLDWVGDSNNNFMGVDALATDPVEPNNLYMAVGLYSNYWDPKNGTILKSSDRGNTFTQVPLPFKVGGNMPGRGLGERLAVDPNNNNNLYFGARSGNGLWRSTDAGLTWTRVASFPDVGTYRPDPSDDQGYNSDIIGIAWVTFDTAKTAQGNSRVFVGVASMGSDNVFMSEDGGQTWVAVAGQNHTFIPFHGVLSPAERALYIPYNNGVGPNDGSAGYVMKYLIDNGTWVDITPAQMKSDNYYGAGGFAVDLQKPGTIMVAALNQWWPDANIYRSTDGGSSWTPLWTLSYPPPDWQMTMTRYYNYVTPHLPWMAEHLQGSVNVGSWIHGLSINPFDSNHWLYGTGLSVFGGHDLTNWDANPGRNITLGVLGDGIDETAVLGLTAPISGGAKLVTAVGDVGGFVHTDTTSDAKPFTNPTWPGTVSDVDHAGAQPQKIVRLAQMAGSSLPQIANSSDGGNTWTPYPGAPNPSTNIYGGKIAMSANGDILLWSQATNLDGVNYSKNGSPFQRSTGVPDRAVIASDKLNNTVFYAGSTTNAAFFMSTDGGVTFQQRSFLGSASGIREIAASPYKAGEIFVSTTRGVWYSSNYGASFTGLPEATEAWSISIGAPKTKGDRGVLYAAATVGGVSTLYRTEDLGRTWFKLNTAQKALGSVSVMTVAGDPNVYKQVFLGVGGRGVFVGSA